MDNTISGVFKQIPPGPNASIWNTQAMLQTNMSHSYRGRVFVEVWEKDTRVGMTGDISLGQEALAALQGTHTRVDGATSPWTDQPVTGDSLGQAFLGRVTIEIWDSQTIVAVSGTDTDRVLANARRRLSTLKVEHS